MRIPLIATEIIFNSFTITYRVQVNEDVFLNHIPFCADDIKTKELILLPVLITRDNMEVSFSLSSAFPSFYQSILDETLFDVEEYRTEINNIYQVGDIVGYIN